MRTVIKAKGGPRNIRVSDLFLEETFFFGQAVYKKALCNARNAYYSFRNGGKQKQPKISSPLDFQISTTVLIFKLTLSMWTKHPEITFP